MRILLSSARPFLGRRVASSRVASSLVLAPWGAAALVLLLALPAVADGPAERSPLAEVAIGASGDIDPLVLFAPAVGGFEAMSRCGEAFLAAVDAPTEVTFVVELKVQPDGRVSEAEVREVVPESASATLVPCVRAEALTFVLASGGRVQEMTATARLRLTRAGAIAPRLLVEGEQTPEEGGALAVLEAHFPPGSMAFPGSNRPPGSAVDGLFGASTIGADDMAIGSAWPDGQTYGVGGLGRRGFGQPTDGERSASGEAVAQGSPGGFSGVRVTARVEDVHLQGLGDAAVYRRVVRQNLVRLRTCVEVELQQRELASGRFSLTVVVNPAGGVVSALIDEISAELRGVEACVTGQARRWRFPEPDGGGVVRATATIAVTIEGAAD